MSNYRETEYATISQCHYFQQTSLKSIDDAEDRDGLSSFLVTGGKDEDALMSCLVSTTNAVVRLQPSNLNHNSKKLSKRKDVFRWDTNVHFHEDLQIPPSACKGGDGGGLCFIIQARAREGLAIALSPKKGFSMGDTYEIIFGDKGNTTVLLRRKSSSKANEVLQVQRPARVCQEKTWTRYWVCLCDGKLYVGIGAKPGDQCIAFLDDIAKQDRPPTEAKHVRYIGVGNAGTGDRHPPVALRVRHLYLLALTEAMTNKLKNITEKDLQFISLGEEEMDDETKELMQEYEKECRKARARAEKFGLPFKEPPSFIPWSQARRLRANPQQGFVTGFDIMDPEEKAKQDARRKRFGLVQTAAHPNNDTGSGEQEETLEEGNDTAIDNDVEMQSLPIEQAWDNEDMVKSQRTDLPSPLWKTVPDAEEQEPRSSEEVAVLVPEKIHLFSIDWAAFKQIRTNDVMKHFAIYGPTYVEWLGDLACNIHFQDKYSATRALHNLSVEIPSPPPLPVGSTSEETRDEEAASATNSSHSDLGRMGWRFGKTLLRKIANDRYGRRGTTARFLLRVASSLDILHERPSSWPKPPDGFSTKLVLGPQNSSYSKNKGKPQEGKVPNNKRIRDDSRPDEKDKNNKGEPSLLDRGLAAARSGFSVEDLERERARKKAKP
ncbi:hypothetical protein ACA910_019958 [Epithemia clementina (nom. ined.)]